MSETLHDLESASPFADRHIGIAAADDQQRMLDAIGYASLDDLLGDAVPASIREKLALALPPAAVRGRASPPNCARSPRATTCSRP